MSEFQYRLFETSSENSRPTLFDIMNNCKYTDILILVKNLREDARVAFNLQTLNSLP